MKLTPELEERIRKCAEIASRIYTNPEGAGWLRLASVLSEARRDPEIMASNSASEFLDLILVLVGDADPRAPGDAALDPVLAIRDSERGTRAINHRHDQAGGSRDKQKKILAAWTSGKYQSRDECADKMHSIIGMSRKTARNALIGAPAPRIPATK